MANRFREWLDDRAAIKRIERTLQEQARSSALEANNPSYEQYVRETEAGRNGPDAWRDHTDRMGTTPPEQKPDAYDLWNPVTGTFADPDRAAELNAEGLVSMEAERASHRIETEQQQELNFDAVGHDDEMER